MPELTASGRPRAGGGLVSLSVVSTVPLGKEDHCETPGYVFGKRRPNTKNVSALL